MGKSQDIRSFFEKKIAQVKFEVSQEEGGFNKQNSPPDVNIKRLAKPNSSALQPKGGSAHQGTEAHTGLGEIIGVKTPPQNKSEGDLKLTFTNHPPNRQKRGLKPV